MSPSTPKHDSKERLPVYDTLRCLYDMEASVFHIVDYLMTKVPTCAPDSQETSLTILKPLNDSAVDFLIPVVKAWSDASEVVHCFASCLHPLAEMSCAADHYHSMRQNVQIAREVLPFLDGTIISIEAQLIAELQRLSDKESQIHSLQCCSWSSLPSPALANLLVDLPQLLYALRHYCRSVLQYLSIIESFVVHLNDFFSDKRRAGAFGRHEEFVKGLNNFAEVMDKSQQYAWRHPYVLEWKAERSCRHYLIPKDQSTGVDRLQILVILLILSPPIIMIYLAFV
ncbi:hypothetical protein EV421DRAFT_1736045 [Armillaria borealis]|uniref:Uncharacterized protein n=1 Tax=Armillaria borealis TaxID=47425 RepID=A0AA39MQ68_9AGAR|nr:hypothetical protein EV421DRAFT_1736045 [Armillaria borealis]